MKDKRCAVCGGKIISKKIIMDRLIEGRLFLFQKVPVQSCIQCGEIWISGKIAEWMDQALQHKIKPSRKISVPVYVT